jgi:hypothetical protein
MIAPRLEVADVFRQYQSQFLDRYGSALSIDQKRVFKAIMDCRTPALGGHLYECDHCAHQLVLCNSCRDRHCPKCQALERAKWTEARVSELLPIPYFHAVFTLPQEIGHIALQNKAMVYGILMRAAALTVKELAADSKHLGGEVGIFAVLHTWGQKLEHHAHVHCVCTGGGISPDGKRWMYCKWSKRTEKHFFIHHDVLSPKFRGKFIAFLKKGYKNGELSFHGELTPLRDVDKFERHLDKAVRKKWVVYAERPFGDDPEQTIKYLARYTHRVAISNSRLIAIRDGYVHFRWKDYRDEGKWKRMPLEATEFIRRFLLHVMPSGFMHIRHYGFLGNRFRKEKLTLCRQLLGLSVNATADEDLEEPRPKDESEQFDPEQRVRCPKCGVGRMKIVEAILVPAEQYPTEWPSALQSRAPPILVSCPIP